MNLIVAKNNVDRTSQTVTIKNKAMANLAGDINSNHVRTFVNGNKVFQEIIKTCTSERNIYDERKQKIFSW